MVLKTLCRILYYKIINVTGCRSNYIISAQGACYTLMHIFSCSTSNVHVTRRLTDLLLLTLQSGGCGFGSQPGLLRTKVYSAFHPSGVGKWVQAAAGKAKEGMAHCRWTFGCAQPVVKVVLWSRGGGLTWRSQVGANPIPIPTPLIWRYLGIK